MASKVHCDNLCGSVEPARSEKLDNWLTITYRGGGVLYEVCSRACAQAALRDDGPIAVAEDE